MVENTSPERLQRVQRRLALFFPEETYTASMLEESLETGDVFFKSTDILPYLQTALIDEKILEVELDGLTRVYFSRLHDDLPPLEEREEDGRIITVEPSYNAGDYLKRMTHLLSMPLEPSTGNMSIRHAKKIVIRLFTAMYAVELGTFFQELTEVRNLPVLRLDYPVVGRLVRGEREYRATVPEKMQLHLCIVGKREHGTIKARVVNISASGMTFAINESEQELFQLDETRTIEIFQEDTKLVKIDGNVRHTSRVRGKKGTEFICGLQFDLATRAVAAKIEGLVAQAQRARLKELSNLSEESGLNLIV